MKALILKDFYTIRRELCVIVPLFILFAYLKTPFGLLIFAVSMVWQAFIDDEKSKWDILVNVLPITDHQVVLSRYIIGYMMLFVSIGMWIVLEPIMKLVPSPFNVYPEREPMITMITIATVLLTILLLAVIIPVIFELGVANARAFLAFLTFGMLGLGMFFSVILTQFLRIEDILKNPLIIVIIIVVSQMISVELSVRFYRKRRFSEKKIAIKIGESKNFKKSH